VRQKKNASVLIQESKRRWYRNGVEIGGKTQGGEKEGGGKGATFTKEIKGEREIPLNLGP